MGRGMGIGKDYIWVQYMGREDINVDGNGNREEDIGIYYMNGEGMEIGRKS